MDKIRLILISFALVLSFSFSGCAKEESVSSNSSTESEITEEVKNSDKVADEELKVADLQCIHELEFGGVYLKMSIEDFDKLGFVYGDSVNIEFSNGYTMEDQPYYNGYYTKTGESLLVAYPGYDYIKACINNGDDLFEIAKLDEDCTATITLNKSGKYADIQDARNIKYTDSRDDYDSDEIFANFRAVKVSTIKDNVLYRSASPCDNQHNRATYADSLIKNANVNYILNLSNDDDKLKELFESADYGCDYYKSLYEGGKVDPIGLNMNYGSDDFKKKVCDAFVKMTKVDGPYLVHCTEGKDRTGYVCMLLEALSGASYDEIVEDYMITYDNYYGINKTSDEKRYTVIIENLLNPMIESVVNDESVDIKTADLSKYATDMLKSVGMTEDEINALKDKVAK